MSRKLEKQGVTSKVVKKLKSVLSRPANSKILANSLDKWERFELDARRQHTLIRWALLTVLGGYFNSIVISSVAHPIYVALTPPRIFHLIFVLIVIFASLVIYCTVVSHLSFLMPETRRIHPYDVALATIPFLAFRYSYSPSISAALILGVVVMAYISQLAESVVRRLVPLGNMGTHRLTLEVTASLPVVASKFSIDVRDALELRRGMKLHDGKVIIYQSRERQHRFVLVLVRHPVFPDKTIVHLEEYNIGRYAIGTDLGSTRRFDKDTDYVKKVLGEITPQPIVTPVTLDDQTFPYRAEVEHIVLAPAESKLKRLSRLPAKSVLVLVGASILALAYYLFTTEPQNALLPAFIGALLVLIPTIPFIRGPSQEKKWQERD